jgi:hypothetical protein
VGGVALAHLYAQSRAIFHYGNSIKGIPLFAGNCMPTPHPTSPHITVGIRERGCAGEIVPGMRI